MNSWWGKEEGSLCTYFQGQKEGKRVSRGGGGKGSGGGEVHFMSYLFSPFLGVAGLY